MAHEVTVENRAALPREAFEALAAALRSQPTIKHALDWLARHDPPLAPGDMVTQDEFSHDILVSYGNDFYLSYDSS